MCNRYGNHVSYRQYVEGLKKAQISLISPSPERAPNLEPRDNIFPTDTAPILRAIEGGLELVQCRWGLIPPYHKGTIKEWKILTTNARSDNLERSKVYRNAFEKRRCLIPADQFYEWTGEKGHKTKWSFSLKDGAWFCFAGLWDTAETEDGTIESFTLITTEAGDDIKPYHHRQPVVLVYEHYQDWLFGKMSAQALRPSPTGIISITKAPAERRNKDPKGGDLFNIV